MGERCDARGCPGRSHRTMEIREQFVLRATGRGVVFAELCREFGVSRKTGYKWKQRFKRQGVDGLRDASRRPHRSIRVDGVVVLLVFGTAPELQLGAQEPQSSASARACQDT